MLRHAPAHKITKVSVPGLPARPEHAISAHLIGKATTAFRVGLDHERLLLRLSHYQTWHAFSGAMG